MSLVSTAGLPNDQVGNASRSPFSWLNKKWRRFSLATQFAIVASIVIGVTMASLGGWVATRIEASVIHQTALSAALYMDRFVEPYVQELASRSSLSEDAQNALHELMTSARVGRQLLAVKIWYPDGTVIYSSEPEAIGKRFPVMDRLASALQGTVASEFDELEAEENVLEKQAHRHILEIYAPIRQTGTQRIIAAAEFYQISDQLAEELATSREKTVLIVGALAVLMLAALSGIVGRGSRTIALQQAALNERIAELSLLLKQNTELREHVADANRRSAESNERFLRRLSAELHDGAVQLIGLAILRINDLFPRKKGEQPSEDLQIVSGALKDALTEIRDLANGFALPELENLSCTGALDIAIGNHERRSRTFVERDYDASLPRRIPAAIKTCAYRFVQEGLNNAFRHAGGVGQRVELRWDGASLAVRVKDRGPGIVSQASDPSKGGLGLPGLKDRIDALGGTMSILTGPEAGTCLEAIFPMSDQDPEIGRKV